MPQHLLLLVCATLAIEARTARAEGTAELGTASRMASTTVLFVDIVDANVERITWTGAGSVFAQNPAGAPLGLFVCGATITPTPNMNGPYRIALQSNQTGAWDIAVTNAVTTGGRLHSDSWTFDTGTFAGGASALNTSFFVLAQAGAAGNDAVLQMRFEGLQGLLFNFSANHSGVNGANAGRSVPIAGNTVSPTAPPSRPASGPAPSRSPPT